MRTRRWTDGDIVWFAAVKLDAMVGAAAQRLGYTRVDDDWCRGYPADVPHLDRAWFNFGRSADMMFRQAANSGHVPWEDALAELCRRTDDVDWWLTGAAAAAVRGDQASPADVTVACSADAARGLTDAMTDWLVEPVAPGSEDATVGGRAFHGARIEWTGGRVPDRLATVAWRGWELRVSST